MKIAEKSFTADGVEFPAGSFVDHAARRSSRRCARRSSSSGSPPRRCRRAPTVAMHDADVPRVAIYSHVERHAGARLVPLTLRQVRHSVRPDLQGARQEGQPARDYDVILMADAERQPRRRCSQPPAARPHAVHEERQVQVPRDVRRVAGHHRRLGQRRRRRVREVPRRRRHAHHDGQRRAVPDRVRLRAHGGRSEPRRRGFYAQRPLVQAEIVQADHPVFYGYADKIMPIKYLGGPLMSASARRIRATCSRATSAATPRC